VPATDASSGGSAPCARAAVVGAGIWGASLAYELSSRGWQVTMVDRREPVHDRAASNAETRILRFAHGSDRAYTELALRAGDLWRELERATGTSLIRRCGVAWLGHRPDGFEAASYEALKEAGVDARLLAPEEGRRLFPAIDVGDLAVVLHEPGGGLISAREAWLATVARAMKRGARLHVGDAELEEDGTTRVDGRTVDVDAVVWTIGAWLPGQLRCDVVVTRQEHACFEVDAPWRSSEIPAWIDYDLGFYGHCHVDGPRVKAGADRLGPAYDPEDGSRAPDEAKVASARSHLQRRFPGMRVGGRLSAAVCQYAVTPDTRFLLTRHPGDRSVFLLGGDSGHGFKHAPALAEVVADWIEGRRADLASIATSGAYAPSLRTAASPEAR